MDCPLVCLRMENENPLVKLNASEPHGIRKVYYQRPPVPYGLVDWPVLVSYVLDARGGPAYEKTKVNEAGESTFAVVSHVRGGFRLLDAEMGSLAEEVQLWRDRGVFVTVIRPM